MVKEDITAVIRTVVSLTPILPLLLHLNIIMMSYTGTKMEPQSTIRCPGCGHDVMRSAAIECQFKESTTPSQSNKALLFEGSQEIHYMCMECKYIVETHYGDLENVTPEDAYTLLYSVRVRGNENCCRCCTIL